jgi:hypothetical protein
MQRKKITKVQAQVLATLLMDLERVSEVSALIEKIGVLPVLNCMVDVINSKDFEEKAEEKAYLRLAKGIAKLLDNF